MVVGVNDWRGPDSLSERNGKGSSVGCLLFSTNKGMEEDETGVQGNILPAWTPFA